MPTYLNIQPEDPVVPHFQDQVSSSGTNILIAAPGNANLAIHVTRYSLQALGTVNVYFEDTDSNQLSAEWSFQAREGIIRAASEGDALFSAAPGKGLNLNLSGAVSVNVELEYVLR